MAKIIKFPRKAAQIQTILSERIKSGIDNLPKDLADCLKKSFSEILDSPIAKPRTFNLEVSKNLSEEELSKIKEGIETIIKSYENDILPILKRLAEKEAELCILRHKTEH